MHPLLRDRRALVAYLATWVLVSYVPASILAPPHGGGLLVALLAATPATLLFGLGALPLYHLCQALPLRAATGGQVLRLQGALVVVWGGIWLALLQVAARTVDWAAHSTLAAEVDHRAGGLFALGALLYFVVTAFHYLVASTVRARASEKRAAAASLQVREARLALLQAQIHPHFLFNSLNAISALTVADPKLARELCIQLADFLRSSLALGERGTVTLSEELRLACTYLDIERARLGDKLTVGLEVTPPAGDVQIPALLLQPLIENAITHGIAASVEGGTLSITAHTTPATLVITITNPFDPGAPPRRDPRSGVGLTNVTRRLSACYAGASLTTNRESKRFTVTLVLPSAVEEAPYGKLERA